MEYKNGVVLAAVVVIVEVEDVENSSVALRTGSNLSIINDGTLKKYKSRSMLYIFANNQHQFPLISCLSFQPG